MAEGEDKDNATEDPTARKLDEAIKRGDVAKSHEINTWFLLFAATMVLAILAGPAAVSLVGPMKALIGNADQLRMDSPGMMAMARSLGLVLLLAFGLPILALMLATIAGNLIQHRFVWSGESLKPKMSKISPMAGFKRLFGKEALVSFGKGFLKIVIVGAVMYVVLKTEIPAVDALVRQDVASLLPYTLKLLIKVMIAVLAIMFFVAIGDYVFQYRSWYTRQRMSIQEIKEEHKQQEGSPEVKGRLRTLRRERARNRMMSNVPKATVVITNPTHFAVALRYDDDMAAPICVAKGMDNIALKIREVARESDVPVVENPPLARALHAAIEIDQQIPEDQYRAVAEVISFVLRLKRGGL